MWAARSVCHRLCRQAVALLIKAMHESKRQTFQAQSVKAQTVNNYCSLHCINELNICGPKIRMTAICTSVRVRHVLIHHLHRCTQFKFIVQQLSLNLLCFLYLQLQAVANFHWIGLGMFKICFKTKDVFLNTVYSAIDCLLSIGPRITSRCCRRPSKCRSVLHLKHFYVTLLQLLCLSINRHWSRAPTNTNV